MLVYKCKTCGSIGGDEDTPFATPICCGVEKGTTHIEGRTASVFVMQSYQSPVDGRWIDTPRQRRIDLANSGSREWEGREQETKYAQQREKDFDKMLDKSAEVAAVESWHALPSETRKVLESGG
jgi:hypothetical protein